MTTEEKQLFDECVEVIREYTTCLQSISSYVWGKTREEIDPKEVYLQAYYGKGLTILKKIEEYLKE